MNYQQEDKEKNDPVKCWYFFLIVLTLILANCAKSPQVVQITPPPPQIETQQPAPQPELSPYEKWQLLVKQIRNASLHEKLEKVNEFFNELEFIEDSNLWGRKDYWATLFETLSNKGGDCEDFTIAKYFTLRNLNVPEESLRITYVISLKTKEPHMVLTMSMNSSEEPLVMDINNNYLSPISKRQDLVPVYSFNSQGYWIAKKEEGWKGKRLGAPSKLKLWASVLQRMDQSSSVYSDG